MPLELRTQSIPFSKGLDSKSDPKVTAKPSRLENAVFADGTISKRPGRRLLTSLIAGGATQVRGRSLYTFNGELCRTNDNTTTGLSSVANEWIVKAGGNNYCATSKQQLVNRPTGTGTFDHVTAGGFGVLAWTNSGLFVGVYDLTTGTFFQIGDAPLTGSSVNSGAPRIVVVGSSAVVLWADFAAGNLYSAVVNLNNPTAVPTQNTIRTDVWTSATTFDAVAFNGAFAAVAYPTSTSNLRVIGVDASGAVTASPAVVSVASGDTVLIYGVLMQRDAAGRIYIVFGCNLGTRYVVLDGAFSVVLAATTIIANGGAWNSGAAQFFTGASAEVTANALTVVLCAYLDNLNVARSLGTAVLGAAGLSQAFAILPATAGLLITGDCTPYDGTYAFAVTNTSYGGNLVPLVNGLESSAYILNLAGRVIAKGLIADTTNSFISTRTLLARTCRSVTAGQVASFVCYQLGRTAFESIGTLTGTFVNAAVSSLVKLNVTKTAAGQLPMTQVGQTLYIGGGFPRILDGLLVGETGFALYPACSVAPTDAGAGNLSAGTYQWKFLYSWVNASGELIRGPPSLPVSLTLAVSHQATMGVGTMPLAMRDLLLTGGKTRIEVYRTQANGTVFNLQSSLATGPQNVTANASTITITDNVPDSDLAHGELLYTTGGILDWESPPAYFAACAHQQRLVIIPSENPYSFMPSSQWAPSETVRFSSFNISQFPADTGPGVALASMDGRLIIFTTQAAYTTIGDGPDNLGNNQYPPAQRIVSVDTGPVSQAAVVVTPLGIMYQTSKGIMLLGRDLNAQFIGADVEAWSTGQWVVRDAFLNAKAQQVRFLVDMGSDLPGSQTGSLVPTLGGYCLLYDYYYQQWSVFPNYGGQDSCLYQGQYTMVRSDGAVWQESPNSFVDNGAPYSSLVETEWIKVAGLQGFQRLWYVTLLGTYYSDFTLLWEVAYDYAGTSPLVPTYSESVTLNGAGQFNLGGPLEVRHHIGHKCEAIKFRLSDTNIQGSGQGMALSDLSFEYGVRKGVFRLPAAKTA